MAMGGRVAEELIFGPEKVSNGAAGDIKMATDQARRMVTEWGMSDKLGMIAYGENSQEVFLGHSVTQSKNFSEETARQIDTEIRRIIDEAYAKAKQHAHREHRRAAPAGQGLLEHETLSGDEIRLVMRGEPIVRERGRTSRPRPAAAACRAPAGPAPRGRHPGGPNPAPRRGPDPRRAIHD